MREASRISKRYNVEVGFPEETKRPHNPHAGHVTVSEAFLKFGVRFPLHPYFVGILTYFNLTVFQLSPKGWAHMAGLFVLSLSRRWDRLLPRNSHGSTPLRPVKAILGFIIFPNRHRRVFELLSGPKTTPIHGRMLIFILMMKALGIASLSQVSSL